MHKTGLVIITKGLTEPNLQIVYKFAKIYVTNCLYLSVKGFSPFNGDWKHNINTCYSTANKICPELDIRLLMPYSDNIVKERDISVILCDNIDMKFESLTPYIKYASSSNIPSSHFCVRGDGESVMEPPRQLTSPFNSVCIGGTFDRLHNGHKILLSFAALMTNKKLFCGVSNDEMVKDKCLSELIEPLPNRIDSCLTFLEDIKPGLTYKVESINHGFGPTITDPHFDCIVASLETKKGCDNINDIRADKGFPLLTVELIDLLEEELEDDASPDVNNETKLSSTMLRMRLLGETLKPPKNKPKANKAYIIGLTGGIACGKSSIATKLKSLGADVIDCDKLGHEAYRPGTECFLQIIAEFGKDTVNKGSGEIDRAALGALVFQGPANMRKLTDIVWPEIGRLARAKIRELETSAEAGRRTVIVIDAAVLLDAGWQDFCDEVWVSFVPRKEAVARIQSRNKLTVEQAEQRIESQKANSVYIEAANVVFCTLWSYEFTHRQLTKAWRHLATRLGAGPIDI